MPPFCLSSKEHYEQFNIFTKTIEKSGWLSNSRVDIRIFCYLFLLADDALYGNGVIAAGKSAKSGGTNFRAGSYYLWFPYG